MLHMIGNAHIDPVWLWQWPEGYQEVRATFSSALDRMDEYPEFIFTSNSVLFFKWVEEHDPELFERIRAQESQKDAGRSSAAGGSSPTATSPRGESFVRHALYGQRFLREKFGLTATTGANFDAFGHNATLPQLLQKSGMDSVRVPAPGPARAPASGAGRSGGSRLTGRACSHTGFPMSTAALPATSGTRSTSRSPSSQRTSRS